MENESNSSVQISEEDLPILGFLPIWIYHSLCTSVYTPKDITKLAMLKALENHTEEEYMGLVGFLTGYLKTNIHKLFEYHYGNRDVPDFPNVDAQLTQAIDRLLTCAIEQPTFKVYIQFLQGYTRSVASNPCVKPSLSSSEEIKLHVKAVHILNLME